MFPTVGSTLDRSAEKHPHHEAIYYPRKGQRWTYAEWDAQVNRLAQGMRGLGVEKGDRVSLFLFNTSEFVTAIYACAKLGAVSNPINYRLKAGELSYILNDAGSKVLIFEEGLRETVERARPELQTVRHFLFVDDPVPDYALSFYEVLDSGSTAHPDAQVEENDPYIIMYTSGTTGRPKGVVHRHRAMIDHNMAVIADQKLTAADRGLAAAPLYHAAELHVFFLPRVHVGASNVILHSFNPPEVLKTLAEEKITVMFGAPTMWNMLLQQPVKDYDLSAFRLLGYGGASMAPAMVRQCHEAFGADLLQYYGMTELGPAVTVLYPEEQLPKAGSAGKAILNHEVRVVRPREDGPAEPDDVVAPGEVGEVIIRGPALMLEYYNRPEATARALYKGWYHSGDLATVDEEGYIWIADRLDDMIISGAENIYPREVEDALYEHPEVLEVAVVGTPDERWGEVVTAYVVPKSGSLTDAELDRFLKEGDRLADYKRPRLYHFVKELPKTASGKIQKFKLRETS